MKFKKFICSVMAIVLSVSLFSACESGEEEYSYYESIIEITDDSQNSEENPAEDSGSSDKTGTATPGGSNSSQATENDKKIDLGGRTIVYHTFWAEPKKGGSDRENNYWRKKTEIEEKYNCKFQHVASNDDTLYDTVITSIIAGKPSCDIMSSKQIAFSAMKQGLFYDLSKLDAIDLSEDKWRKSVTEFGTLNGKQYLMEAGKMITANMVLYNKDLFAAEKAEDLYALQKDGKLTLDKLISVMKGLYDGKTSSTVVDIFPFNLHIQFAYAYGGQLVTRKAGTTDFQSTINSTQVTNGFKAAQELLDSGVVVNNAGSSWTWARDEFLKGNYPILVGSGDLENIASNCSFELGACSFPTVDGGSLSIISDVQWAAIPYNVKNPDEVAVVWNEMADYIFDVNYKNRYQDIVPDDVMELLNSMSKRQVSGDLKIDYYNVIDIWADGVGVAFNQMIAGSATPASTIQTVNTMINSKLKTLK